MTTAITEEWLRSIGFRWEQLDKQPTKHWLLWLADACIDPVETSRRMFAASEDLGIEVADDQRGAWFCWLRADYAGRYSRFLHVRHIAERAELVSLIEAVTGRPFIATDVLYGSFRSPEQAKRLRNDSLRLDRHMALEWGKRVDSEEGRDAAKIEKL